MSYRDVSGPEISPCLVAWTNPSAGQEQTRAYNRFSFTPVHESAVPCTASTSGPQRTLTLSPTQPASPRSFGIQDKEYGITHVGTNTWPSPLGTNSRIPNLPLQPHQPNLLPPSHPSSLPASSGSAIFHNFDSARSGLYSQSTFKERDSHLSRSPQVTPNPPSQSQFVYTSSATSAVTSPPPTPSLTRCTLWWGELEPWMDEEYAKQVCSLMGWDPLSIKVPHPPPDSLTGQQANNPGYCFLTFPTPAHAASVLAQINNNGSGTPLTMPNSNKPFLLNWASSTPTASSLSLPNFSTHPQQHGKEYSIFVGDLAPEASNSDLVSVFRNPVLGLRNDREPKFIRPFLSCKSAKIMLDPVTGVSRGYGFVRFTDEADQQRALIEMHGLYCLSRPMRISPATAKYKAPPAEDLPQVQIPPPGVATHAAATIALPLPALGPIKSVSSPIAGSGSGATSSTNSLSSAGVSSSGSSSSVSPPSLSSGPSTGSTSTLASTDSNERQQDILTQLGQYAHSATTSKSVSDSQSSIAAPFARQDVSTEHVRYSLVEESWKHQAQARAILSHLIGPNGEQLTSTDPYNTTVFVGGLSPLISEDTLRTFFAPFGDIHYVKVPVGKHCGFVQFVRKADAERAIEKMQGFSIGGSRIRLSWGRSQYKAAQAAAQAAQAAALQAHVQSQMIPPRGAPITMEQTVQLLQQMQLAGFLALGPSGDVQFQNPAQPQSTAPPNNESLRNAGFSTRDGNGTSPFVQSSGAFGGDVRTPRAGLSSSFSPFSPEFNLLHGDDLSSGPPLQKPETLLYYPSSSTGFAHGFPSGPVIPHDAGNTMGANGKVATRYAAFHDMPLTAATISRPPSGPFNTSQPERHEFLMPEHEHDIITDLNGTLASLDLDAVNQYRSSSPTSTLAPTQAVWKTPGNNSPTAA
ncbi:hypothetical protein F5148DRAFT_866974 [Russula earlei]|uniref:Uncharacterized protein n=1 Tax=Russula earlei TaxID=71964 RepID=A0ACC0UAC5_9AGAM|nr:hypothetical protein F5148DRAFT_866974 [Russula earlei]